MVLHTRGRVGSRHFYEKPRESNAILGAFFVKDVKCKGGHKDEGSRTSYGDGGDR